MIEKSDDAALKNCLGQIETRLNRGPGSGWTNYDFEKLSAEIEQKTGVLLSITTLKRIWGKIRSSHIPTQTTLNALARFLDADDWRAFINSQHFPTEAAEPAEPAIEPKIPVQKQKGFKISYALVIFLFIFAVSFLIFSGRKQNNARIDASKFQFSADKVMSKGVPNSVVFTYDASAANTDSIYIVQTWDIRRKTLVSKYNNKHSAIYYYPGFFNTKLIIDSIVVKSHDLQITSDGWLGLVENEGIPVYFKKEEIQKSEAVSIDSALLKKYNITLQPEPPRIRFFHQGDMGDLMNDNFIFETTLRNRFNDGNNACQFMQVLIQCKNDIIIIPLSAKNCAGDLSVYAAGKGLISKEADLTGFGTDLNEWTTLRVETVNKKMTFFVNGNKAASFVFPNEATGIVGVQYRFNGLGDIKDAWFENKSGKQILR